MEAVTHLAEVLVALSLTTDLGSGVPFEKGLRTSVVASRLATALDLSPADQRATYFAALLRSLGCTAHASVFAEMFDDDVAVPRELKTLDLGDPAARAAQTARFSSWAGPKRAQRLVDRFVTELPVQGPTLGRGSCEVSAALGARLKLPQGAIDALDEVYERYDGKGFPEGRQGDELSAAARVVHAAEQAVLADYEGGATAAVERVEHEAGGRLDPDICARFVAESESPLAALDELGHSTHVAGLVERASELGGHDDPTRRRLRASALLIDIGRVGVSSAVWDRPGPLGPVEWERVRLHPSWTERILRRCSAFEHLASLAAPHHERLDGSGYHRAAKGSELSAGDRLLAAADAFAAMTEPRPHRPAHSRSEAASILHEEVRAGRMDAVAVEAIVEAAGLPRRRTPWPNDLTDREVEVLRVLARGVSNREIAETLVLSPRTVQQYLASVYDKIGLRTRAGAAVFAIENGLVPASSST